MEKNWIKFFSSSDFYRSEIVKQVLCEHEIDAVLLNKQALSHRDFGDVEVYIHQQDFGSAVEIMILNQL
ncbi:MAG TPA: hypothetical protein VNW51_00055 [Mucilaginibacter sp.]|jgi:hypothetical protein|nr:hypothetical protein [Mucilaginibacter sp.]